MKTKQSKIHPKKPTLEARPGKINAIGLKRGGQLFSGAIVIISQVMDTVLSPAYIKWFCSDIHHSCCCWRINFPIFVPQTLMDSSEDVALGHLGPHGQGLLNSKVKYKH